MDDIDEPRRFLSSNPCGRRRGDMSWAVDRLQSRWIPESRVVYIGKADATPKGNCLRKRVNAYLRFGAGRKSGHAGGYRTWQLADSKDLVIVWKVIEDEAAQDVEDRLLLEHVRQYGALPFANDRPARRASS